MAVLVFCLGASAPPVSADRSFAPARFTTNDTGNITMIANTLETCPVDPAGQTACSNAQNGADGSTLNNNDWVMRRIDQDTDPATTLDSSSASLSLPPGATVLFAGLYFGAVTTAGTSGTAACADPPNTAQPSPTLPSCSSVRNTVKLKVPGASSYTTLTAPVLDISSSSSDGRYQGFVNVTSEVSAAGNGTYWVGDVREATGKDRYGGWSIVIAYKDPTQPLRNLTVFDGLQSVTQGSAGVKIPLKGFLTPPSGQVQTTLGVVAYEGDRGLTGDSLSLNTTKLTDDTNPMNNFFNSAISSGGVDVSTKSPNYANQLGFDAILVNANGVLANNATSADITLQTTQDQYFPGVVTFATNLYSPNVQATKSVANVTHPGGPNQRGDTLRYTVAFTNSGQDGARDFLAADVIPPGTTYVPNSLRLVTGPGAPASPTDASGDDIAAFNSLENRVVFRLGSGANATQGGLLAASGLAGNSTSFTFDVTINGNLPVGTQIPNNATAQFLSQTLATPLTAVAVLPVPTTVAAPDLTLSKAHSPQFVGGAPTTFTLAASNVGTIATDGTSVTVTDNFPNGSAGFDSIAVASAPGWACTIAAGTMNLTCTRSDALAAGASYPPISVTAVVHNPVSPTIQNTAAVSGGGDSDPTNNTATDVGAGTSAADLDVTKTVDQSFVPSGGQVTFNVKVHNSGPSTAVGATLDDALGASYTDVSVVSSQGTCSTAVHCDFGDLPVNATATLTITATINATDTTVANTATVSSSTSDPVTSDNSATASFVVPPTSDLNLTKTISANPAASFPTAGVQDGATYTLTVRNAGPDTAANVKVVDPLPPSFTPSTVTAPGFTCAVPATAGGTDVACTRPTLAVADGTFTIAITGTFDASASGTIVPNGARADSNSLDPDPASAQDTINTLVIPAADLELLKSAPTGDLAPGGAVTFTLSLLNNGPSPANAATITDTLPAGLTFVSGTPGCGAAGATVTCSVGSVASGASSTVAITAQAATSASGQTLTNSASAASTTPDPDSANNQASTSTTVRTPAADLQLTKTASAATVDPGGTVDFTLALHNNGPDVADAATVTDTLPAGLAFVSGSSGCSAAGAVVSCDGGSLAADSTTDFIITASPTAAAAGQTLTNAASATSTMSDPDSSNNQASAAVEVTSPQTRPAPRPDLVAGKTASATSVAVGSDVTFVLSAANQGGADATGVTITDPLPPGLAVTTLPNGCSAAIGGVACAVGTLSAGESRSFSVVVHPTSQAAGQTLTNIATVSGNEQDPTPTNDAAGSTITVGPLADLVAEAHVAPDPLPAGGDATYTIVIDNNGPSEATGIEATDVVPSGVVPSSIEPSQGECTRAASKITCDLGSLPAGGAAQVTVDTHVDSSLEGKTVKDVVDVVSAQPDPDPKNNTVTLSSQVGPPRQRIDLSVGIRVREHHVRVDGLLHFTITGTNHSGIPATGVRVTDAFSAPVRFVSVREGAVRRAAGAVAAPCSRRLPLVCNVGRLGPHSSIRINLVVRPLLARTLFESVSIRSNETETTLHNNRAKVLVNVLAGVAAIQVQKTARERQVQAGSIVHYAIVVRAPGTVSALAVHVCDRLPGDQVYSAVDGAAFADGQACWTIGRLAPGTAKRFTVAAIAARIPNAHRSTNTVRVLGANIRPRSSAASVRVLGASGRPGGSGG